MQESRVIYHIDMDAFYASVETVYRPELKGKPMVVGGLSPHGIVATANYEAREYGIHSAMPIFMARQRCPHVIVIPPNRERYKEASRKVFEVFEKYTEVIEGVSIDEAYLDMSQYSMEDLGPAKAIKQEIYRETGLSASVGVSYNKFLAKLASEWKKPNGLTIIREEDAMDLLEPLDIGKVHGVGPKTQERLRQMGFHTIQDLRALDLPFLTDILGKFGPEIYYRIRGIDHRPVEVNRERKSIGVERTFDGDTASYEKLESYLKRFCDGLSKELVKRKIQGRTVILKLKDANFQVYTRSKTQAEPVYRSDDIFEIGRRLLQEMPQHLRVRLLGITVASLLPLGIQQLSLFDLNRKE